MSLCTGSGDSGAHESWKAHKQMIMRKSMKRHDDAASNHTPSHLQPPRGSKKDVTEDRETAEESDSSEQGESYTYTTYDSRLSPRRGTFAALQRENANTKVFIHVFRSKIKERMAENGFQTILK